MKIRVVVFLLLISFASTLSAVTYQCSPAAGGKITHSGKNTTATPNSGYTFSKWSIKINSQSPTYSTKNPDDFSSYELLEAMEYASVTITANFTAVTTYTITWKNYDGSTLTTSKVTKGTKPSYTGATPTRPSTAQYAYTFSGWTPTIVAASANATYTATYTSTPRYTVSFDANGGIIPVDGNMGNTPAGHITTLNGSQTIGSVVVTKGKTDFRTMSNDCPSRDYYSFLGWYTATTGGEQVYNSSGSYVAGTYWDTDGKWKGTTDVQLYAQWLANTYTITWKQDDGTTIDETLVEYNQMPTHDNPTKPATAEWTYSFASWTPAITAVTGNATYTAKYDSIPNCPIYGSGTCGANLTWELSCDSVLTISGTGAMTNFSSETDVPWYSKCSSIKSVIISDGVTSIGGLAFSKCSGLTSVTIPNSVTSIEDFAFVDCSSLISVTIPNNVTHIGDGVFMGCSGLTSIVVEASTPPIIETTPFPGGYPIYVPCGTVDAYKSAWSDYASRIQPQPIASGTCGASGDNLTWELSCDSVLTISGTGAMSSFSPYYSPWSSHRDAITAISLPDGLTSIGYCAFRACTKLTSATIPSSVTNIGADAFFQCYDLDFVIVERDTPPSLGDRAFGGDPYHGHYPIYVPCGTVDAYKSAWGNDGYNTASRIQTQPISGTCGEEGDNISWELSCDSVLTISGTGNMAAFMTYLPSVIYAPWYEYRTSITSVIIESGVTGISAYAFSGCSNLRSVIIPEGVTFINDYAFFNCTSLPSVSIPSSVSELGGSAFRGCSSLTSIIIPNKVYRIRTHTFEGCSSLASVTIPNSVKSIGNFAFKDCSNLTLVTIPNSVYAFFIEDSVFYNCAGLESIVISNKVSQIGTQSFGLCTNLNSITCEKNNPPALGSNVFNGVNKSIPLYVPCSSFAAYEAAVGWSDFTNIQAISGTKVEPSAGTCAAEGYGYDNLTWELSCDSILTISGSGRMDGCSLPWKAVKAGIKSVVIEEGVTSIADSAFYQCTELTTVTIPESVTRIERYAFAKCSKLSSITIPDNVICIRRNMFDGCTNLSSVTIGHGVISVETYAFYNCKALTSIVLPDNIMHIMEAAFMGCSNLNSVALPQNIKTIEQDIFSGCDNLPVIDNIRYADTYLVEAVDKTLSSYTIQQGTKYIGSDAFSNCQNITSIFIPNTVLQIGNSAFSSCGNLSSISIPGSVIYIGNSAFSGCTSLPVIDNIRYADTYLVAVVDKTLSSYTIQPGTRFIGSSAFLGCKQITTFIIPNTIIHIGNSAFSSCGNLSSISIPGSVIYIGNSAFSGCTSLPVIDNIRYADTYLVAVVDKTLSSYTIQPGTRFIGDRAFSTCSNLTSITIPDSVIRIGLNAFNTCSNLSSIALPKTLTDIGNMAFYNCNINDIFAHWKTLPVLRPDFIESARYYKTTLHVPAQSIDSFKTNNPWKEFKILPIEQKFKISWENYDGTILYVDSVYEGYMPEYIGETPTRPADDANHTYVFAGWTPEVVAVVCDTIYTAKYDTVPNCSFYGSGTCGANLTWELSCDSVLTISGTGSMALWYEASAVPWYSCRHRISGVIIENGVTNIGSYAFDGCYRLTSVTIPSSVTRIESRCFYGCSGLTSITIPDIVTYIGGNAFGGCSGLTEVNIPNSVTSIGGSAFYGCSGLTSVSIPNNITSISGSCFYGCHGLTSITIPNGVTSIGQNAFRGCSGLTSITIPNSITNIGIAAFYGCYGLTSITIPNGVTSIRSDCFHGCLVLTSITIPNGVTSIGQNAFRNCSALTSVEIPSNVSSIGAEAFQNCSSLTSLIIKVQTPPTLEGTNVFSNTNNCPIYVPCGTVDAYKSAWSDYSSRIQTQPIAAGDCGAYDNLTWELSCDSVLTISGNGAMEVYASYTLVPWNYYRQSIKYLSLPDGITSVRSFQDCSNLVSVTIPTSVTLIGAYPFRGCSGLTSLIVENGNAIYDSRNNCNAIIETSTNKLLVGCKNTCIPNSVTSIGHYSFSGCSGLTGITIPDSVISIGYYAFDGCTGLTSMTIPSSVTSIGSYAFFNCSNLTSVTIEADTPPTLGSNAFDNTNDCPIYVPCGTIDAYKSAWSSYASRIQNTKYTITVESDDESQGTTTIEK